MHLAARFIAWLTEYGTETAAADGSTLGRVGRKRKRSELKKIDTSNILSAPSATSLTGLVIPVGTGVAVTAETQFVPAALDATCLLVNDEKHNWLLALPMYRRVGGRFTVRWRALSVWNSMIGIGPIYGRDFA